MWIAGAGRGRQCVGGVEMNALSFRGYRTLRNENPRMGVRGGLEGDGWGGLAYSMEPH
jgi:hypothetical protein